MSIEKDDPAEHYDRVTRAWQYLLGANLHYGYFSSPRDDLETATLALTARMAERAELTNDLRVLDVGCGLGTPALHLASTFECNVLGITTSKVGVEMATSQAASHPHGHRVKFEQRDAMDNQLPAETFDRVWAMESSHLMENKKQLISECARVMKRGAKFVLCDINQHQPLDMKFVLAHAKEFDLLRRVYGRAKMETTSAYRSWCETAGLEVTSIDDISDETICTFERWKDNADKYKNEVIELIGIQSYEDFKSSCDILKGLWRDRVLGYFILAAQKP